MRPPSATAWSAAILFATLAVVAPLANAIVTPTFTTYAAPGSLFGVNNAGEPSVGDNWLTGNAFFQAGTSTYKIVLSGATPAWSDVTPPNSFVNIDPILATDSTLGRTWAGGLGGSCSILAFSNTDGASWTPSGNACSGTADHETIGSGPWAGTPPLGASYSHAVYYCAQTSSDACATSMDGGLTFGAPVAVFGTCGRQHGHVKVANDGVAYLPNSHCAPVGTGIGGGITLNNGANWNSYNISGTLAPAAGFDASVGVTNSSWVYEAWQDSSNHMVVALSKDHAVTWINMTDLSGTTTPAVQTATMPAVVAGSDDRVAVAYLGTTTSGNAFASGFTGTWDLYVSFTYDGGHSWTTVKTTTNPVQRGWICTQGTTCPGGRNLLDFIDATMDKNGRVIVGYADGCINTCAGASGTIAQSTSAWATIAVQTGGTTLY
jgi:hypothetical protein